MALVRHSDLTWPEAEEIGRRDDVVALVPIGAIEQHGPHLPMRMDTALADALATRVAHAVDRTMLVMQPIPFGLSEHHVGFPGTITVPEAVVEGALEAYVQAAERMGVDTVVVLSGHGGNFALIGEFARARTRRIPQTRVVAYDDLRRLIDVAHRAGAAAGSPMVATDAHAGLMETSIALALFPPSDVRDFDTVDGYTDDGSEWMQRVFADGVRSVSQSGVLGAPQGSTAELGERILDALVGDITSWLEEALG